MSMENTPDNLSEIHWLRLDKKRPSKVKSWFKLSETNGLELIEKCKKLEDVESALQNKCKKPTHRYTKVELLRLKNHPLSQKPPVIAESLKSLCGKSVLKDEVDSKKDQVKKKTISRTFEQGKKYDAKENDMSRNREKPTVPFRNEKSDERKLVDPAARIRKEQDICLSPQRKSFTTGCFVQNSKGDTTEAANNSSRKNSESNSSGSRDRNDNHDNRENRDHRDHHEHRDHRESKENRNSREPPRRIGSGRIMPSDPPFVMKGYQESRQMSKDKPTVVYKGTFQGKSNDRDKDNVWNRQKNVGYYDKRKNQYSDHSHEEENKYVPWDQHRHNNFFERRRPYHNDYHRDDEEEKEPEWMRDGPGSKNDMIELKGFDESVERFFRGGRKTRHSTETNKKTLEVGETSKRASESDTSSVVSDSVSEKPQDNSTENNAVSETISEVAPEKSGEEKNVKSLENHSIELNLDEIFKEPLLDLNAGVDSNESARSKFALWFKRDDTNPTTNAVASSNLNESLQSLISEAPDQGKASLPTNDAAPIDAANQQNVFTHSSNLLDLLRGSQENTSQSKIDVRALEATGKLHCLEEIEAKWRGTDKNLQAVSNSAVDRKKKEEEAEAFKKLLSQAVKKDITMYNIAVNDDDIFTTRKEKNENGLQFQQKTDLSSLFCNGDAHPSFPPNMLPPQVSRMLPLNNLKQFPVHQNKQEMLSKMFMSNSSNNFASSPQQPGMRTPNASMSPGVFSPMTPEIQNRINECQPTRELMHRQETINMLKALKKGDLTVHNLIEQYKKTTPSQLKFRECVICVLKLMQQTPYVNSSPFMGSPMGMSFNMPPPPHTSSLPYNENIIQQMIMNSQYRSGLPNIVYQRDFPVPNQNIFQNNMNKKLQAEQTANINQMPARMNSPLTIGVSSMSNLAGSNSMSPSSSINISRDNKNSSVLPMKSSSSSQSHSFTPISVLRQLSADKENLDTMSRDSKETKLDLSLAYSQTNAGNMPHSNPPGGYTSSLNQAMPWNTTKQMSGEKNALVPYSATNSNQCSSVCISAGVIEHLNSFGSCIPPPAISGQYFVGNMIRPSNMSSSIPVFSNPPPPILSRLPVLPNTNLVAKGSQKLSVTPSQLQQMQQKRAISSHIPQSHDPFVSSANRTNSDGIISSSACGNQNSAMRNSYMNGLLPPGDDQLNRLFSCGNLNNPSFPLSGSNVPVSVPNIISVEEIERMQQSVRN